MNTIMRRTVYSIKELKRLLSPVFQENDVASAYLFGSYARGEAKRSSDVDLAIRFKKNSRKSLFDLVGLKYDIENVLKKSVDVGTVESMHPIIKKHARLDFVKLK